MRLLNLLISIFLLLFITGLVGAFKQQGEIYQILMVVHYCLFSIGLLVKIVVIVLIKQHEEAIMHRNEIINGVSSIIRKL